MDYILYCDESEVNGRYYSNFYGGALISGKHFDIVNSALKDKKIELNLNGEVKWSKATDNYLQKYMDLIDVFFSYIKQDIIKIRIMFSHNTIVPLNLTNQQKGNAFFKLYYQFFKHAFGLQYCNDGQEIVYLKPYFDTLPDKKEKCDEFKDFILRLQGLEEFKKANIKIRHEDIAEVRSHDHVILQCMDIILGSMFFRLNDFHLVKHEGSHRRGKRTVAKEKLYKHILKHIKEIYPNFNIGITTGIKSDIKNRWKQSYSHWSFKSKEYEIDFSKSKKTGRNKSPVIPT
jgi:hypothetical protein